MKWVDVKISFSSFPPFCLFPMNTETMSQAEGMQWSLQASQHFWLITRMSQWSPLSDKVSPCWILLVWHTGVGDKMNNDELMTCLWHLLVIHQVDNWTYLRQQTSCKQMKRYGSGSRYMLYTNVNITSLQCAKYCKTILRDASMTSFQLKYIKVVLWDIIIEPSAYTF